MAQASKRARRERRQKRELSLYHRWVRDLNTLEQTNAQLFQLRMAGSQLRLTLLAILGQAGGQIEVAKETLEKVANNQEQLSVDSKAKDGDPNIFVISLVTGGETV